ncbi:uncharacterized protein Z518_04631 [Rhinocladiella mackenziei CBS 650.93]|uniref:BZIP domain-containing protein n=1 Tax=Rhinocladiella mackenziei CBS 650.93 TaxID=1442369 RepID=A0A0D2JC33_9EURO|nr:uncharacterized protein Z518_04631 [Rhinocladiella mackenziei CBS 650.93]KIX06655.1 hypothetical protein Z518_04631 [Rhinocladiella mackenziei CBS 650.93]
MASEKPSWKQRFTHQQLERKRYMDRIGQRRTRMHLKRTVTALEERLSLLLEQQPDILIQQLMAENEMLQASLSNMESRMGMILQCSRESLEESANWNTSTAVAGTNTAASASASSSASTNAAPPAIYAPKTGRQQSRAIQSPNPGEVKTMCDIGVQTDRDLAWETASLAGTLPFFDHVLFHGVSSLPWKESSLPASDFWPTARTELVETILSWKFRGQHGLGFEFLLKCCGLEQAPVSLNLLEIRRRILSKNFWEYIHDRLLKPDHLGGPSRLDLETQSWQPLTSLECEQRAVALCACEVTTRWRKLFRSETECIAMYWSLYTYFLFLSVPSEENLLSCPPWLWPTRSQLTCEHPGFIDFLIWPALRDKLISTWHQYKVKSLSIEFVRHFEIQSCGSLKDQTLLRVKEDLSGLDLDPRFKTIIYELENWTLNDSFGLEFPDLLPCASERSSSSSPDDSTHAPSTVEANDGIHNEAQVQHGPEGSFMGPDLVSANSTTNTLLQHNSGVTGPESPTRSHRTPSFNSWTCDRDSMGIPGAHTPQITDALPELPLSEGSLKEPKELELPDASVFPSGFHMDDGAFFPHTSFQEGSLSDWCQHIIFDGLQTGTRGNMDGGLAQNSWF